MVDFAFPLLISAYSLRGTLLNNKSNQHDYLHTSLGEHVSCVSLIQVASVFLTDPSTVNSHLYDAPY